MRSNCRFSLIIYNAGFSWIFSFLSHSAPDFRNRKPSAREIVLRSSSRKCAYLFLRHPPLAFKCSINTPCPVAGSRRWWWWPCCLKIYQETTRTLGRGLWLLHRSLLCWYNNYKTCETTGSTWVLLLLFQCCIILSFWRLIIFWCVGGNSPEYTGGIRAHEIAQRLGLRPNAIGRDTYMHLYRRRLVC